MKRLYGGIEAGGTKFVCMVATDPDHVIEEKRFSTTHPDETILKANLQRSHDYPILIIGRDASDDFGFERGAVDSLACPVFFNSHETWQLVPVAGSFREFLATIAGLEPGQVFIPSYGK